MLGAILIVTNDSNGTKTEEKQWSCQ